MSSTNATTAPQAAVVIERTYRATAEELWALWTTKAGFESW
ncbi:MAG: SRPBCC domain-containing protein, partial [Proteobacteria bacterium]|nr:SRPBCC domain-containing protein [Pseudomonadota bacterium]